MIQLEQQQHGEFVVVGGVADTNYLYPARWGWIKNENMTRGKTYTVPSFQSSFAERVTMHRWFLATSALDTSCAISLMEFR